MLLASLTPVPGRLGGPPTGARLSPDADRTSGGIAPLAPMMALRFGTDGDGPSVRSRGGGAAMMTMGGGGVIVVVGIIVVGIVVVGIVVVGIVIVIDDWDADRGGGGGGVVVLAVWSSGLPFLLIQRFSSGSK